MFSKGSIDDFQNFRTKRFRFIFVLNLLLGQLNDKYRTTAGLENQNLTLLILLEGVHRNKIYLVNFRVALFQIKNVEEVCSKNFAQQRLPAFVWNTRDSFSRDFLQ